MPRSRQSQNESRIARWQSILAVGGSVIGILAVVLSMGRKFDELDIKLSNLTVDTIEKKREKALSDITEKYNQSAALLAVTTFAPPVGTILPYAGNMDDGDAFEKAHPQWKLCIGQPVSRKAFPELFACIKIAWGSGDGIDTFNLPDLRGLFLRGVDQGAHQDPEADSRKNKQGVNGGVGSFQSDSVGDHLHSRTIIDNGNPGSSVDRSKGPYYFVDASKVLDKDGTTKESSHVVSFSSGHVDPPAFKTRPKNAYVYYIIRVKP